MKVTPPTDIVDNAVLLITEVREALAAGTKHFNKAGKLLETEIDIITCMKEEGGVTFEPSK